MSAWWKVDLGKDQQVVTLKIMLSGFHLANVVMSLIGGLFISSANSSP